MQKENLFFLSFLFLDLSIHSQPDFNNKAVKWLVFHIIPSTKKTNHAKSRQTTTAPHQFFVTLLSRRYYRSTIQLKKSFIVSRSLKRNFAVALE